jgi:hypothetical protein
LAVINGGFEVTTGLSKVQTLDIAGNLLFNTSAGVTGQYVQQSGSGPIWNSLTNVRMIRYATYFTAQDLNSGVGPTAVVFDNVSPISNIALGSVSNPTGISQPTTTTFTIGTLGTYDIDITGFINSSSAGIGNSSFALVAEVNSILIPKSVVSNGTTDVFSGRLPSILIPAGATLRILTTRLAGSSPLNTNAPFLFPNNFSSVLSISLVNTI